MGGLVSDDHLFVIESVGPQKTRFFQSIVFTGLLVPLSGGLISAHQKGLENMNVALKKVCEEGEKS